MAALLYAVNAGTDIWAKFRTQPPASEVFASKDEVADLREKLDGIAGGKWATRDELREAHGRIDDLTTSLSDKLDAMREAMTDETKQFNRGLEAIHRSIGQLEGRLSNLKK